MPNKLLFSERVISDFTSIYSTGLEIYLLQIKIHCCITNHNKLQTKCIEPETIFILFIKY